MRFPYGTVGIELHQDLTGAEVLESGIGTLKAEGSEDDLVLGAMADPIGSPTLRAMAKNRKTAVIIISDHTRPVPSKHIIPFMLAELRAGNPDIDVTLLVATGFHRGTTKEELTGKLGADIVAQEKILVHDCQDDAANVDIGVLPSGARLVVNRTAAEADLLIAEGFIEPHFFAGFSGGRKSVLPGICSKVTVLGNHCSAFIDSPCARTGVLEGNPLHRDMVEAAKLAGLAYIVNVVIDEEKRVAKAFAGDPIKAHEAGCAFLKSFCRVKPMQRGDIVITSNGGAPLDQNVYQSVKGLTAAEAAAAPGAVLIISSRCNDGAGGEGFYRALRDCASPAALQADILKVPMDETHPDQWEYQILSRIRCKHKVIFVSEPAMKQQLKDMKLDHAPTLDAALETARAEKGGDAHVVVIPNGISVIVEE